MFRQTVVTGANQELCMLIENVEKRPGLHDAQITVHNNEQVLWLTVTDVAGGYVMPKGVTVTLIAPDGTTYRNRDPAVVELGDVMQAGNAYAYALALTAPEPGVWQLTVKDEAGSRLSCQCFVTPRVRIQADESSLQSFSESSAGKSFAEFCTKLSGTVEVHVPLENENPCSKCVRTLILTILAIGLIALILALGARILAAAVAPYFPPLAAGLYAISHGLAMVGLAATTFGVLEALRWSWDTRNARTPETLSTEMCRALGYCY